MKCLSACVDKMTIANSGSDALISRAASIPFRTGMVMFITTTSGLSRCASSTAAAPSWASPQTSNRGWESNICRTLFLITGWSSATRIRRRRAGATVGLVRSAPRAIPKSRREDGKAPYSRASTAKENQGGTSGKGASERRQQIHSETGLVNAAVGTGFIGAG
jgi:hypothetical protein